MNLDSRFFRGVDFENGPFKALMPEFYPKVYQEYIREEATLLKEKIEGAERILEAGVGIGRLIPELAPLVREFVGVDNTDRMLVEANRVAERYENAKIVSADLESLGEVFPHGHFEHSLCVWNTLGNVNDEVRVLDALREVTKKSIIVTTYLKGTIEQRKEWYKTVGIPVQEIDTQNEVFYTESGLKSKSYAPEEMERIAKQSGLKVFDSKKISEVMLWSELALFESGNNS